MTSMNSSPTFTDPSPEQIAHYDDHYLVEEDGIAVPDDSEIVDAEIIDTDDDDEFDPNEGDGEFEDDEDFDDDEDYDEDDDEDDEPPF